MSKTLAKVVTRAFMILPVAYYAFISFMKGKGFSNQLRILQYFMTYYILEAVTRRFPGNGNNI